MNTFGMKKKGQSPFWLKGGAKEIFVEAWRDIKEFTLKIRRIVEFTLER